MSDVNVRSDSVDVEQIMKQIRQRIREKRGADYTEAELKQLASVKLEQFADPSGLRSDLLDQFRQRSTEPSTYHRHRGVRRMVLMMMHPILKRVQKQLMADLNLYFEIIHNLVVEVTRLGMETQNLKMKVEALSSRLDFDERRARSLEGVVQYKTDALPRQRHQQDSQQRHSQPSYAAVGASGPAGSPSAPSSAGPATSGGSGGSAASTGSSGAATSAVSTGPEPGQAGGQQPPPPGQPRQDGELRRRRRRRRRRRPGQNQGDRMPMGQQGGGTSAAPAEQPGGADADGFDDGPDDGPDENGGAPNQ
jgi:hypothetical protein